jgi:rhodanese-related sulfurtransferase
MHKGDVMPAAAYEQLMASENAYLIDVRTDAEWNFVGVPAVDRLLRLSWQSYPTMERNGHFVEMVEEAGIPKDAEIFLICRSGARSAAAANALTDAGFANCYNVAQGFEGDRDGEGHRGTIGGWKRAGLPWVQG